MNKLRSNQPGKLPGQSSMQNTDVLCEAGKLLGRGYSQTKVANMIGISQSTISRWVASNPKLRIHIKLEEEKATDLAERALFDLAMGSTTVERKFKIDENGIEQLFEVKEKNNPQNVAAVIYWLKNKRPTMWSERYPEPTSNQNLPLETITRIERMTPDQREARLNELYKLQDIDESLALDLTI